MNCSFPKSLILEKVGPVSEAFVRYGCEDIEFGYRISMARVPIIYLSDALAWHHEYNGSLGLYLKKLYIASRDSAETLYELAPGARNASKHRYLEPVMLGDSASLRFAKWGVRLALQPVLFRLARRFLEVTDQYPRAYLPFLFRFVSACASLQGVRDRSDAKLAVQGQFFE